jgi:hypothetical protein
VAWLLPRDRGRDGGSDVVTPPWAVAGGLIVVACHCGKKHMPNICESILCEKKKERRNIYIKKK